LQETACGRPVFKSKKKSGDARHAEFDIIAEALILHRGRHTAVGDVTITDAAGDLVAKALTTFAITRTPRTPGSRAAKNQKKES
jgi:hypothetical protein